MINKNSGSLMLELCIALAIFTILLSHTAINIFAIGEDINDIRLYEKAQDSAQKNLKTALASTSVAFNVLKSYSSTSPPYTDHLVISDITPCKKKMTSKVEWQTGLRNRNVEFSASITDPSYSAKVGGDCDGTVSANSLQKIFTSHPPDISDASIDVINGNIITSLLFNATTTDIDAIHGYAFLTRATSSNQVLIADTKDPANPQIIAEKSLPGVAGSYPGGRSLYYFDNKLYVGVHRTAGHEFHIFDVTDRKNPIWLGSREMNHNINQIIVRDNYAYLATSGNTKDVIILNISNPSLIQQVYTLELAGNEDSQSLFLMGNLLFIGKSKAKTSTSPEFVIVDISNPTTPTIVGSLLVNGTVSSIQVHDTRAYVLIDSSPSRLLTINISKPNQPTLEQTEVLPDKMFELDYEENKLYGI